MNKNRGSLTIEASVSLVIFWFFMMFILNAGQVYRAQTYVTHGVLQAGKMLAYNSYDYNHFSVSEAGFDKLFQALGFNNVGNNSTLYSAWNKDAMTYNSSALNGAMKYAFGYCASSSPAITNQKLKEYGLENGIDSIEFKASSEKSNLVVDAEYKVKMPFAFLGIKYVTLRQHVKCGLWS